MTDQRIPDWLPDWRDSESYPDPLGTPRKQWAWEFLRRNKNFQAEWKATDEDQSYLKAGPSGWVPRPDYVELDRHWRMLHLGAKWGLSCPAPNPSLDVPDLLLFQSSIQVGAYSYEATQQYPTVSLPLLPERWENMTVLFDLTLPLHPQLAEAKEELERTKARFLKEGRITQKKYAPRVPNGLLLHNYVRTYDAHCCGASIREIADFLFVSVENEYPDFIGDQRVRDSIKAATELVSEKFRSVDKV